MDSWAKDWDNPQDAVYDKIRSSVITSKEMFEASIRTDERERIVALLEADGADCDCHDCYLDKADQHWRYAIELIEGQK